MNALLALVVMMGAVVAALAGPVSPTTTYPTKYDNVDLDEVLSNDRLYKKYFDCLMNRGRCTPDGKLLKDVLPEALSSDCNKCSDKQKAGTDKVLKHLFNKKPRDYDALEKLYDPAGVYRRKYKGGQ